MSVNKLLLHLTARGGKKDELVSALPDLSRSLCAGLPNGARATTLVARDDDPMRMTGTGRPTRAFDATLEIRLSESDAGNNLARAVRDLGPRLESRIHADSSAILVGENNVFVSCDPTPIRYQYCMRRRADFSPAAYLARYGEVHSAFGIKTRGIAGYTQFHVDAEASRQAAEASGFGNRGGQQRLGATPSLPQRVLCGDELEPLSRGAGGRRPVRRPRELDHVALGRGGPALANRSSDGLRYNPLGRFTKRRASGEKNHPPPAFVPPSTGRLWPLMNEDRSLARKSAARA